MSSSPQQSIGVPVSTRVFYGIGSISEGVKETAFNVFLLFYYNNVLGLSGSLTGLAIFLALCVDAFTDPLMGVISDNTRSRLGRRHPYMYLAAVPVTICFALLFAPPDGLADIGLFVWLLGFTILLRVSLTLYAVPSNAMAAELTSDYDERTEVIGIRFLFGWMAGLGSAIVGYLVFFNEQPGGIDGRMQASAYQDFALYCALVSGAAILMCALGTQKTARLNPNTADQKSHLVTDFKIVFSNPSFRALIASSIFSASAWGYINSVGYYVNTYYWQLSGDDLGILTIGMVIAVAAAASLSPVLGRIWDKKNSAMGLAIFAIVFGPIPVVLRQIGWFPDNGTQDLMVILFFHVMILTVALICISILTASMIADLTDQGEHSSGRRLEGAFSSIIVFSIKASTGIGALIAGLSLDLIDFPRQLDQAAITDAATSKLGWVYVPAIMVLYFFSVYFLNRYQLKRTDHTKILQDLADNPSA
ncbi:MAG: MFS transporter [Oceanococcus sp.]